MMPKVPCTMHGLLYEARKRKSSKLCLFSCTPCIGSGCTHVCHNSVPCPRACTIPHTPLCSYHPGSRFSAQLHDPLCTQADSWDSCHLTQRPPVTSVPPNPLSPHALQQPYHRRSPNPTLLTNIPDATTPPAPIHAALQSSTTTTTSILTARGGFVSVVGALFVGNANMPS
jgi:hypothetical protein